MFGGRLLIQFSSLLAFYIYLVSELVDRQLQSMETNLTAVNVRIRRCFSKRQYIFGECFYLDSNHCIFSNKKKKLYVLE